MGDFLGVKFAKVNITLVFVLRLFGVSVMMFFLKLRMCRMLASQGSPVWSRLGCVIGCGYKEMVSVYV